VKPRASPVLIALALGVLLPRVSGAQSPEAYLVGAAGGWTSQFGGSGQLFGGAGGVEFRPRSLLGVGGEVGAATTPNGGLLLSLSADARVHVTGARPDVRVAPFAGLGYSRLLFFEGTDDAVNVFGGVDVRLTDSRGLRFELRDMIRQDRVTSHYWTFRAGVTFR
jgi:hypothetical protein